MTGRQEEKSVWDLEHVVLPVKRLVGEYDLTWDKQPAIPLDTAMLDRLFTAGLELAALSGVYCISTGRVIHFSQDEIVQAMYRAPRRLRAGHRAPASGDAARA